MCPNAATLDGRLWRRLCEWCDRVGARQIPSPALTAPGASPLSETACLDLKALREPSRFYPPPPPVRPDVREKLEEADGVAIEQLAFSSAVPLGIAANDRVAVRLYRPAHPHQSRFSLLVLPGIWRQDRWFEDRFCRGLASQGVSAALLALPFHWERAPQGTPSGGYFLSGDPLWTAAAFRQAVVDSRAALSLLRGRGAPVGVVGFSLGGVLAHILMALEPVDLGVSVIAGGDVAGIVWESPLTQAYRRAMEARGMTRSKLAALWAAGNPTSYAGRSQAHRLLMLNARYDLLLPRKFTEELWQTHGQPPIRWLPAGHRTAFLFGRTLVEEILAMIGPSVAGGASLRTRRKYTLQ